jgi:hypothetical protein
MSAAVNRDTERLEREHGDINRGCRHELARALDKLLTEVRQRHVPNA